MKAPLIYFLVFLSLLPAANSWGAEDPQQQQAAGGKKRRTRPRHRKVTNNSQEQLASQRVLPEVAPSPKRETRVVPLKDLQCESLYSVKLNTSPSEAPPSIVSVPLPHVPEPTITCLDKVKSFFRWYPPKKAYDDFIEVGAKPVTIEHVIAEKVVVEKETTTQRCTWIKDWLKKRKEKTACPQDWQSETAKESSKEEQELDIVPKEAAAQVVLPPPPVAGPAPKAERRSLLGRLLDRLKPKPKPVPKKKKYIIDDSDGDEHYEEMIARQAAKEAATYSTLS